MATKQVCCLITGFFLWVGLVKLSVAVPSPPQSGETVGEATSVSLGGDQASYPRLEGISLVAISAFENPFVAFGPSAANEDRIPAGGEAVATSAPVPYPDVAPAAPPSSSSWAPTHFEIFGFVQWRNLSSSSGFSSSYCTPSGCVTNSGSFSKNLGLKGFGIGPDFGFIWTPEKKILGAKSKIWVEWEELDRSKTFTAPSFQFLGTTASVDNTLQTRLNTNLFSLGYAPRWGNDKFRVGPEIVYQHLSVQFILTNLTPGAPPPIKQDVHVPNNLAIIGPNFDFTPVRQLDIYGRAGWIPCCGGGWHGNETEFGAKYYIRRNFSILGGFKYYWLKRDFNLPATTVTVGEQSATLGPFSGFIKFPGIGPFVGASVRF